MHPPHLYSYKAQVLAPQASLFDLLYKMNNLMVYHFHEYNQYAQYGHLGGYLVFS